jgi:hypothetical protein
MDAVVLDVPRSMPIAINNCGDEDEFIDEWA